MPWGWKEMLGDHHSGGQVGADGDQQALQGFQAASRGSDDDEPLRRCGRGEQTDLSTTGFGERIMKMLNGWIELR